MADCYLAGVWTGRMDKLVKTLGIHCLSKSQVLRMAGDLDEHVESFRHRPLDAAGSFTFVAADALTMKGREGGLANIGSAVITILFLVGTLVYTLLMKWAGRRTIILVLFSAYAVLIGGTQILQWIYPNELFPTEIRGPAVGLASSLSRIGAAVGTYLLPTSLVSLGIGPTMLIGAAITLLGFATSWRMAPETKDRTLAETGSLSVVEPGRTNARTS